MQRGQIQLQGITFPLSVREQGASIELMKFATSSSEQMASWAKENALSGDKQWGIVAHSETQLENMFLTLTFRKVQRTRLRVSNGRVEKVDEEYTEPEIGEFHLRSDGIIELYSLGARQRTALAKSLEETFGKECLVSLFLQKDAMKSLMTEAIEVSSVSLTGLGNPFFNDVSFAGTDPAGSKTYKDLSANGEIKSFRAKYPSVNSDPSSSPLLVTIRSNCKVRFIGGQTPVSQANIEDFVKRVSDIASDHVEV